ncbi:hypothetical protein OR16_27572 [Cupriavidus basilensis OR16]|uniref:Uncharacterized protein n=1 Tax=Cupriavidus basilensis OR16 TaxID=1127483 RepID=H1SBF9_9BURK|nr:hypothetical protein [Cupriavidus basilensis]EHP40127.1 hypothetical protein OR16_27572 [Cupriavidus basilensis OR16]
MKQRFWNLFLIPSTYGFLIWTFLLSLLGVGVIELDVSVNAMLIFGYVVVCFLVSNVLIRGHFYSIEIGKVGEDVVYDKSDHVLLALSTLFGFIGLFLYVYDFSASFGGIGGFFTAFFNDPLEIRALAEDSSSIGFQISYFSWLSIFYCLFAIFAGKASTLLSTLVDKFLFSLIGLFGFF